MRLILCGLPGSGKSTLGAVFANQLNYEWIDLDVLVGSKEKYKLFGEKQFRCFEANFFQNYRYPETCIISLGGGTLDQEESAIFAKKLGKIVYLKGSVETLFVRLSLRGFPSFFQEHNPFLSLKALAEKRCPIFERVCDMEMDIEFPIELQIKKIMNFHEQ